MLIRTAIRLRSPAGPRARLSVVYFHRVLAAASPRHPDVPDQAMFERQLEWLRACFTVLPLPEAVNRLRDGSLPAGAAAITFDDGYADNYLCALPVLQRLGLHATFFIATGFLDGGIMWNDAVIHTVHETRQNRLDCSAAGLGMIELADGADRTAIAAGLINALKHLAFDARASAVASLVSAGAVDLPRDLMLSTTQLRALHAAGMEIGAHTINHPILSRCPADQATREIRDGKRALESIVDAPVDLFAYPNGKPVRDYLPAHVDMARAAGFKAAFTTMEGVSSRLGDPYQIPRFLSWDRSGLKFNLRMLLNLGTVR